MGSSRSCDPRFLVNKIRILYCISIVFFSPFLITSIYKMTYPRWLASALFNI
jgi:hypothetical protein